MNSLIEPAFTTFVKLFSLGIVSFHLRPPEMWIGVTIRVNLPAQPIIDIYRG